MTNTLHWRGAVLVSALLSLGFPCYGGAPDASVGAPSHYAAAGALDLTVVLRRWQDVAEAKHLPPSMVASVVATAEETLKNTTVTIQEREAGALGASFAAMMDAQGPVTTTVEEARGTGYWLSICIAEAVSRPALTPANAEDLRKNHERLVDLIMTSVEKGLRNSLTPEQLAKVDTKITEGTARMRTALNRHVGELRDDYLFPAFKSAMSAKQEKALLAKLENTQRYPVVEMPHALMETPEEVYVQRLKAFFGYAPSILMFDAAMVQIAPMVNHHQLLGEMLPNVRNTNCLWPVSIRLTLYRPQKHEPTTRQEPSVDTAGRQR